MNNRRLTFTLIHFGFVLRPHTAFERDFFTQIVFDGVELVDVVIDFEVLSEDLHNLFVVFVEERAALYHHRITAYHSKPVSTMELQECICQATHHAVGSRAVQMRRFVQLITHLQRHEITLRSTHKQCNKPGEGDSERKTQSRTRSSTTPRVVLRFFKKIAINCM
jgi:hypothetical protein